MLVLGSTVDTCSSVAVLWRCLFQFTVRVADLLFFTETGPHSVKLCKVVDYPVMAQRTFPLVPCSRPQRFHRTLSFTSSCVQRQLLGRCSGAVHRRFSRPCDHAAAFAQWTVQLCNREGDSTFSIAVYGGGEGGFSTHFASFFALLRLSRS